MKKALWLTVWFICFLMSIYYSLGWVSFGSFLFIAGFFALLCWLVTALLKKRSMRAFFGRIVIMCITVILASNFFNGYLEKRSKMTGSLIIEAISDYKNDHGELPDDLKDLVPAYLRQIPRTSMRIRGTDFFYSRNDNAFRLGFAVPYAMIGMVYDSRVNEWRTYD